MVKRKLSDDAETSGELDFPERKALRTKAPRKKRSPNKPTALSKLRASLKEKKKGLKGDIKKLNVQLKSIIRDLKSLSKSPSKK